MSVKISRVTEQVPAGSPGGYIRERIGLAIASARRQVQREKGILLPTCTVKIVIEQEFDDGK